MRLVLDIDPINEGDLEGGWRVHVTNYDHGDTLAEDNDCVDVTNALEVAGEMVDSQLMRHFPGVEDYYR